MDAQENEARAHAIAAEGYRLVLSAAGVLTAYERYELRQSLVFHQGRCAELAAQDEAQTFRTPALDGEYWYTAPGTQEDRTRFAAECAGVAELKRKYGKPMAEIREWQDRVARAAQEAR